jgi:hypothetical protein
MFSICSHLVPLQAQAQIGAMVQALVVQSLALGVGFMLVSMYSRFFFRDLSMLSDFFFFLERRACSDAG